jgi:hypothetical protein
MWCICPTTTCLLLVGLLLLSLFIYLPNLVGSPSLLPLDSWIDCRGKCFIFLSTLGVAEMLGVHATSLPLIHTLSFIACHVVAFGKRYFDVAQNDCSLYSAAFPWDRLGTVTLCLGILTQCLGTLMLLYLVHFYFFFFRVSDKKYFLSIRLIKPTALLE